MLSRNVHFVHDAFEKEQNYWYNNSKYFHYTLAASSVALVLC
jgi:hypothetical protein